MDVLLKVIGFHLFSDYGKSTSANLMDLSFSVTCFFMWFILHYLSMSPFRRFGRKWLAKNAGEEFAASNEARIHIFSERLFCLLFHILSTVYCFVIFHGEKWWFYDCYYVATIFPYEARYSFWLKLYYSVQLGYSSFKSFRLLYDRFMYGVKKEFLEKFIHHTVSLVLIIYSFQTGYAYYGILVFFIHGITDIPGYITRLLNDVKSWMVIFGLFSVPTSWAYCRCYVFPRYIIGTAFEMGGNGGWRNNDVLAGHVLIASMVILYILHIYWLYGICRVSYFVVLKLIFKKDIKDPRKVKPLNVIKKEVEHPEAVESKV